MMRCMKHTSFSSDSSHIDSASDLLWEPEVYEAIAFIGNTLSPFFCYDPKLNPEVHEAYNLLISCAQCPDVVDDEQSWPFIDPQQIMQRDQALGQIGQTPLLDNEVNEELLWDYRMLFVGPAKLPAPPYGSVYLDVDGVIFGNSCIDLRTWMKRNGLRCHINDHMPEDHIAKMLMMMAFLATDAPQLLPEFLQDHLLPWAPHYLTRAHEAAHTSFFKGLFTLTRLSLEGMAAALHLQTRPAQLYR